MISRRITIKLREDDISHKTHIDDLKSITVMHCNEVDRFGMALTIQNTKSLIKDMKWKQTCSICVKYTALYDDAQSVDNLANILLGAF